MGVNSKMRGDFKNMFRVYYFTVQLPLTPSNSTASSVLVKSSSTVKGGEPSVGNVIVGMADTDFEGEPSCPLSSAVTI